MTRQARQILAPRVSARPSLVHVLVVMGVAIGAWLMLVVSASAQSAPVAVVAPPAPPAAPDTHAERQLWRDSFAALARRADLGDAEAARLALQMRGLGPRVYGVAFNASAEQLERWRQASQRDDLVCAFG